MLRLVPCFVLVVLLSCRQNSLLQHKLLSHYPSASAVEYRAGRIYIMGDDASYLLVLDSTLSIVDSITIFPGSNGRIPKNIKPDLEAMTLLKDQRLMISGSASLDPYRFRGLIVDPSTKEIDSFRLDTFYSRFHGMGVKELNIEGMTAIPGGIVFSNRGNLGYRYNELLFTTPYFWQEQGRSFISRALFGFNSDTTSFQGVSGLAYSRKHDLLIATVSTENTRNALDDGKIGKSYLWLVKGIGSKTRWKAINPDRVIDLVSIDSQFEGQKVESVCVLKETQHFVYLLLVADNDNGSSNIFKLAIRI